MNRGQLTRAGRLGALVAPLLVCLLIGAAIALYSWLAVLRHESFGTSAMDLGYTDQVVWNTLHGRLMHFSTYENASIDLPLERFRRTDNLLAYHVELLLVPLSLLYLVFASPLTLLLVQTALVPLGAWPAFLLARDHLDSELAGVVFAAAYLLAPAVEGAMLADLHVVSLAAPLVLWALYCAHHRRYALTAALLVAAMLAREDISLVVTAIGLYLALFRRAYRVGAALTAVGLLWFAACMFWIIPSFNGLGASPFMHRLAIFGATPGESLRNALRQPALVWAWVNRPEIRTYLGGLLASGGLMSLFSPLVLGLAAPQLTVNVFSTWGWTYSEGEHYSIVIMPLVIASAIYGLGNARAFLAQRLRLAPQIVTRALVLAVLAISGWHHHQIGVSPLAKTFYPPTITDHHRLGKQIMARIPAGAPLSAQSNLYPHLAQREKAYLYPAINDAEYVMLDVTSTPYPLDVRSFYYSAQGLLRSGEFGVVAAQDGYLLLHRGASAAGNRDLPASFYTFACADCDPALSGQFVAPHPVQVRYGEELELVGYEYRVFNLVQAQSLPATVTTYWRALKPLERDYAVAFFFTREDGAVVFGYDEGTPTSYWFAPPAWPVGHIVRVETPVLEVGRLRDVLVAVALPMQDVWKSENRLPPEIVAGPKIGLADQDTLLRLFTFPD